VVQHEPFGDPVRDIVRLLEDEDGEEEEEEDA